MMPRVSMLLIAVASAATFAQTTTPPTMARGWRIPLTPCKAMGGRIEAMCGNYEVFEDRASRADRKIKLNVMVLPATAEKAEPDPVFPIAGGPGDSAVHEYSGFGQLFRQKRDVVIIDQRGAGASHRLTCDFNEGVAAAFARLLPIDRIRPLMRS